MKKFVLTTILALATMNASAEDFTGKDKQKHFVGSMLMSAGAAALFNNPQDNIKPFSACMTVGLLKEVNDSYRRDGSGFSRNDLLADAVGCYTGTVIGNKTILFLSKQGNTTSINIAKQF